MQCELGAGDEVITIGGLYGTCRQVDDETVTLEVAPGVELHASSAPGRSPASTRARPRPPRPSRTTAADEPVSPIQETKNKQFDLILAPPRRPSLPSGLRMPGRRHRYRETRQPWHHLRDRCAPGGSSPCSAPSSSSSTHGLLRRQGQLARPARAEPRPRPGRRHAGDAGGDDRATASRRPRSDLEQARQIIENRVNALGVAEAEVVTEGNTNIVISVAGQSRRRAEATSARPRSCASARCSRSTDGSGLAAAPPPPRRPRARTRQPGADAAPRPAPRRRRRRRRPAPAAGRGRADADPDAARRPASRRRRRAQPPAPKRRQRERAKREGEGRRGRLGRRQRR